MDTTKPRNFHYDTSTGTIHLLGRTIRTPRSRPARIAIGIALVIGGIFSFLPILGVWMIPLGLLVLSQDIPRVRRWRRSAAIWFGRRRKRNGTENRS